MFWTLPLLWSLTTGCVAPPPADRPPPKLRPAPEQPICLGSPPCEDERVVQLDLGSLGADGFVDIHYDHAEVTRRVRLAQMGEESALSVAVRLLLGEAGAERLLGNQHGREEALAILYTVQNRLDASVWNPEDQRADPWPGCESGATFASCANPDQYLGLRSWRALHPDAHVDALLLDAAVGEAVVNWWLVTTGAAADPTGGATSFVHRCGGAAYGQPTTACDGEGDDDVEGAEAHTGPVVFRGPEAWDPEQGRYRMWRKHEVAFLRAEAAGG